MKFRMGMHLHNLMPNLSKTSSQRCSSELINATMPWWALSSVCQKIDHVSSQEAPSNHSVLDRR